MHIRRLLLTVGATSIAAAAIATTAVVAAQPPMNAGLYQALRTKSLGPGAALPSDSLVARVGTERITASQLARSVGLTRYNNAHQNLRMSEAQIRTVALNRVIRFAALHQRAVTEGVVVSDAEVTAWIGQQSALRASLFQTNRQAEADFNAMIAALGVSDGAAYDRDPRTIALVRRLLEAGKLTRMHLGQNASPQAAEQFAQETIANASVQVFVTN